MSTVLNFRLVEAGQKFTVGDVVYKKTVAKKKTCCSPKRNAIKEGGNEPVWFDDTQAVEVE